MNSASKELSFTFKPEETLKVFKNILPEDLVKELGKAIKNNDEEKAKTLMGKVKPIIDNYQSRVGKDDLEGEQVLWMHDITKGLIHEETVERWLITNLRVFKLYPVTKENPKSKMISVGLAVADTVVMNQHRSSSGSRVGTFTGVGGRSFTGVGVSTSSSTSRTYGDLVFFFGGREAIRFRGISDPNGVCRMVETIKKQRINI